MAVEGSSVALTRAAETNLEHDVTRYPQAHHEGPPAQQYWQDGLHTKAGQGWRAACELDRAASDCTESLPISGTSCFRSFLTMLSLLWLLW